MVLSVQRSTTRWEKGTNRKGTSTPRRPTMDLGEVGQVTKRILVAKRYEVDTVVRDYVILEKFITQ